MVAAGFAFHAALGEPPAGKLDPDEGLTQVLAAHGLAASPSDVAWIDAAPAWWWPWRDARAWVLAAAPEGLDDVYLAFVRRTPEGAVLELQEVFNISETRAAAESDLAAEGPVAAWVSGNGAELLHLQHANLAHHPLQQFDDAGLSSLQRWQWRLTWLQDTGHVDGIAQRAFKLVPPATDAHLDFDDGQLRLTTASGVTSFTRDGQPTTGGEFVAEQRRGLARPGNLVTWSVDRVRGLPWFGDENMQRLKAVVYVSWDWLQRRLGLGEDEAESMITAASPSRAPSSPTRDAPRPAAAGPGMGVPRAWPPPALEPLLSPAQEHEGQWVSLNGDPFIKPSSDPLGHFYTTFLRTDPEREFSRILITAWDPLTVELHMMSGTDEPKSATGETGSGLVPRDPDVIQNLVAAFNGGFQASHGDFGMMVDGTLYVPPLPFAATVARDVDGRVGMGTWPPDQSVPKFLSSFRQNLTPLVADGRYNPYGRSWWGGVPSGWEDETRTVRSGLCLTEGGLVAYFYGAKVDAEHLAKAMLALDCSYGLHLDMNQGHTGLEFYHVDRVDQLPPLAMRLDKMWQAEGAVSDAPGLRFRGRRLFRSMQLMNFPRFIRRESRDFFYLTARPMITEGVRRGLQWSVPHEWRATYPAALATASFKPDASRPATRVNVAEFALEFLSLARAPQAAPVVTWPEPSPTPDAELPKLWWVNGRVHVQDDTPEADAHLLAVSEGRKGAQAALCAVPAPERLMYAEIATGSDPKLDPALLERVLSEQGCQGRLVYWTQASRVVIARRDLSGHPTTPDTPQLHLSYRVPRRSFQLFPDTPVVPREMWKPLQKSR